MADSSGRGPRNGPQTPKRSGRPGEAVAALVGPQKFRRIIRLMRFGAVLLAVLALPSAAAAQPCTESLTALFDRVSPAVVSIQAMKINKIKPQRRFETIVGSGLIIDRAGEGVTNPPVGDGAAPLSGTLHNGAKGGAPGLRIGPLLAVG